jgi:hypothetical protein
MPFIDSSSVLVFREIFPFIIQFLADDLKEAYSQKRSWWLRRRALFPHPPCLDIQAFPLWRLVPVAEDLFWRLEAEERARVGAALLEAEFELRFAGVAWWQVMVSGRDACEAGYALRPPKTAQTPSTWPTRLPGLAGVAPPSLE